jgi:hypothetical protein
MARALRGLPVTAEAFAAGRLSYSKVRAITRVADPDTEVELVELAAHATASQVERVVRAWRRADEVDAGRVVVFGVGALDGQQRVTVVGAGSTRRAGDHGGTVTLPAIEVAPPPGDLPRPALTIVPPGLATSSPWPCRPLRW